MYEVKFDLYKQSSLEILIQEFVALYFHFEGDGSIRAGSHRKKLIVVMKFSDPKK